MTKGILDCSDELLLKIFAHLATKRPAKHCKHCNYYQLSRTCSRFYQVALPLFYHEIRFMTKDNVMQKAKDYPILPQLEILLRTINTHPERGGWIHYARFEWIENSIATWHATFDLCARLPTLRTLSLRVYHDLPRTHSVGVFVRKEVTYAKLLGGLPALSCTCIDVEDRRLTIQDVARFCALPKLEHFKVINLCSEEGSFTAIPAVDVGPVRRVEFIGSTYVPGKPALHGFFKKYSTLEELSWKAAYWSSSWDPSDTLTSLLPLCSTLVKLRLSIGKGSCGYVYRRVSGVMDFTQFTALEVLEVHDLILFPRPYGKPADPYNFPEKLPESLEELQIIIDQESDKFGPFYALSHYDWILSLPEHKLSYLKQLSTVTIKERKLPYVGDTYSDSDMEIEGDDEDEKVGVEEMKDQEEETGREGKSNEVSEEEVQINLIDGAVDDSLESWEEISSGYHSYEEEPDKAIIRAWRHHKTELRDDVFHGAGIELRLVISGYRYWGEEICIRDGGDETQIEKSMSILMRSLSD